jgi:putative spermidine/putrescine transport system ATP-binding protein
MNADTGHGASVRIEACGKTFADGTRALEPATLDIARGETLVLLGPSGCGKTTMLRIIAGLELPDPGGLVLFDGKDMTSVPIEKRNVGMVFQSYALFPNMSVADNIGYGLKIRGIGGKERAARVAELVALTNITGLENRRIDQLSGGQRQRVALARAVAIRPGILLLDEPLTALDAALRDRLRGELNRLLRALGITTIYVTHDQEEALVISDRICIMQGGRVHQVAAPLQVYSRPATLFVASFVGSMNVFERLPVGRGGEVTIGAVTHALPGLAGRAEITLAMRPEDVILSGAGEDAGEAIPLGGAVDKVTYAGREAFYRLTCADGVRILAHVSRPDQGRLAAVGERLAMALPLARLHAFDPADGRRVEVHP